MKEQILLALAEFARMEPLPKYAHLAYLDWFAVGMAAFCLFVLLPYSLTRTGKWS